MPSSSPKQHRFMEAIAHNPTFAKKAGVPQSVGKDFATADDKAQKPHTHNQIKFFHNKGFVPKGGIRHPGTKIVDANAFGKLRPTQ